MAPSPAFVVLELGNEFLHPFDGVRHADLPPVDAGDGFDLRLMTTEHLFERQQMTSSTNGLPRVPDPL